MTILKLLRVGLIAFALVSPCLGAPVQPQPNKADEIAAARLKLEVTQADFTRSIEEKKLEIERLKAWITGASLMVPLMVAALTLALGVWNQNQQAKLLREAQAATERSQFELKVAELVLDTRAPTGTKSRARILQTLFPTKLPDDFASAFNPKEFSGESYDAKKAFFEVLATHPNDRDALVEIWMRLFPGDEWPKRLIAEMTNSETESPKA